ncbi:MAG: hypothetical protein ACRDRQ_11235 [Pseudonocardiaceae bacterium]
MNLPSTGWRENVVAGQENADGVETITDEQPSGERQWEKESRRALRFARFTIEVSMPGRLVLGGVGAVVATRFPAGR